MTSTDVVVIGGGIAGLCSALAVAERGATVIVIDSRRAGAASAAAAGMLAPSIEGLPAAVRPLALAARDFYPEFLARLHRRVDVPVALSREGILELASSPHECEQMFARATADVRRLDAKELAQLEPAFQGHAGGLLYADDGCVDNVALMHALDAAIAREPNVRRLDDVAVGVQLDPVSVLTASGEKISAGRMLLAAGAWANALPGLPRTLPVRPVHGELLLLAGRPISHVTYGAGGYLIPRGDSLLIGATSDDTGFESPVTAEGLAALLRIAGTAVSGLQNARVVSHWSGLRPVTPDTLPILGPDPRFPALVYACGFSRNGILLAPWAAAQLAPVLAGEQAPDSLDLFSVHRFSEQ